MKNPIIILLAAVYLLGNSCTYKYPGGNAPSSSKSNAIGFESRSVDAGADKVLDSVLLRGSRAELSLIKRASQERLSYRLVLQDHSVHYFPSSHFSASLPEPRLNLDSGSGIVVHPRDDGKAVIIEEWVGAAVANSDPIFINYSERQAWAVPYSVSLPDWGGIVGVGSRKVFAGWLRDGSPDIRVELDE